MNFKSSIEINFNLSELKLLCPTLVNELYSWNNFCLSLNTTDSTKSNYQEDMISLDKLIYECKCLIDEEDEAKIFLHSTDIGFIIEALDNEIKMYSSSFSRLLTNLRNRIKIETLSKLGGRFLEIAHYDRSLK